VRDAVTTGLVVVAGEITTTASGDYPSVVRRVVEEVGYTPVRWVRRQDVRRGWCAGQAVARHRPGVNEDADKGKDIGAGDQGLMFRLRLERDPELMPMPIALAHRLIPTITELRQNGTIKWCAPDSKSQ